MPGGASAAGAARGGWIEPVSTRRRRARWCGCSSVAWRCSSALELLLELLLVEQLPAGDAVDLRAQFGDAVFVGELHFGLTADQAREHVLVEREIGAGGERPDAP